MAQALAELSAGRVVQPVRTVLPIAAHRASSASCRPTRARSAPSWSPSTRHNEGIPTHHAVILLFRAETGEPLAMMDGRLITEMRTAAASAVATQQLARAEASVLAILGSGVQAQSHLQALRACPSAAEVRVWSPRNARAFAAAARRERRGHSRRGGARRRPGGRRHEFATTPVLHGRWLSPGTHVNAVGATRPNWRELDDDLVTRARVFVDSREGRWQESGDVMAARDVVAEIGEVVSGVQPGRRSAEEITLFKSVGVAVEDVAAAALVYDAHRKTSNVHNA